MCLSCRVTDQLRTLMPAACHLVCQLLPTVRLLTAAIIIEISDKMTGARLISRWASRLTEAKASQ